MLKTQTDIEKLFLIFKTPTSVFIFTLNIRTMASLEKGGRRRVELPHRGPFFEGPKWHP
jgi:hypothetical protein